MDGGIRGGRNGELRAAGKALDWDGEKLVATNCPEAGAFVNKTYRAGWEVA